MFHDISFPISDTPILFKGSLTNCYQLLSIFQLTVSTLLELFLFCNSFLCYSIFWEL